MFIIAFLPLTLAPCPFNYVTSNQNPVSIEISSESDVQFKGIIHPVNKGFNHFKWNLKIHPLDRKNKPVEGELVFVEKGNYKIAFTTGDFSESVEVTVK